MPICSNCERDLPTVLFDTDSPTCKQCPSAGANVSNVSILPNGNEKTIYRSPFPEPLLEPTTFLQTETKQSLVWRRNADITDSKFFLTEKEAAVLVSNVINLNPAHPVFHSDRCYVWMGSQKEKDQLHVATWFKTSQGVKAPYALFKAQLELPPPNHLYHCGHLCKSIVGVHSRGLCVNPFHLQWQTPEENMATKLSDGHNAITHPLGEAHPRNKFCLERVLGVINDLEENVLTLSKIALKWHVHFNVVADISRGKTWNYITGKTFDSKKEKKSARADYVAETVIHKKRKIEEIKRPDSPSPFVTPASKICTKCNKELDISQFYSRDGVMFSHHCKICHGETNLDTLIRRTETGEEQGFLICNGPACKGKQHPVAHFAFKNRSKGIRRRECKECTAIFNKQTKAKMKVNGKKKPDPAITEKHCPGCNEILPIARFYMRPHGAYELRCRECQSRRQMELRKIKPAQV